MTALIARLEAATEGSGELDLAIFLELHPGWKKKPWKPRARRQAWFDENDNIQWSASVEPYTTSLDAALPWENIEEVALHDVVEGEPLGCCWEAWHADPETGKRTMGAGWTEAIARRVAALKARVA